MGGKCFGTGGTLIEEGVYMYIYIYIYHMYIHVNEYVYIYIYTHKYTSGTFVRQTNIAGLKFAGPF